MKRILLMEKSLVVRGTIREVWGLYTTSCGDFVRIANTPLYDSMLLAFRGAKRFCRIHDNYKV